MNLTEIATRLRKEALYIGGNHYTLKEAEDAITALAKELDKTAMELAISRTKHSIEIKKLTGITDQVLFIHQRQENIKKNKEGRDECGQ